MDTCWSLISRWPTSHDAVASRPLPVSGGSASPVRSIRLAPAYCRSFSAALARFWTRTDKIYDAVVWLGVGTQRGDAYPPFTRSRTPRGEADFRMSPHTDTESGPHGDLLRRDKPEPYRFCFAKNAVALPRLSRSSSSTRFSFRTDHMTLSLKQLSAKSAFQLLRKLNPQIAQKP